MRYMMLVKSTKDYEAGVLPDEKMQAEMDKCTEELVKAGALLAGGGLQPSSKGVRVRYAKGKFKVDRRALRRDEGVDRRLLDDRGEIAGGGHRMGQAHPFPGWRGRGAPAL